MSIMQIAKIKNANSSRYRKIVSEIYFKYKDLYKIMNTYAITDSLIYIYLAYKCFEEKVAEDFDKC